MKKIIQFNEEGVNTMIKNKKCREVKAVKTTGRIWAKEVAKKSQDMLAVHLISELVNLALYLATGYGWYIYVMYYIQRLSIPQMVKELNRCESTNSKHWTYSTIRNILRNRVYVGDLVIGKRVSDPITGKRNFVPESEQLIIENHHEAIIDKRYFNNVQQLLQEDKRKLGSKQRCCEM